MSKFLANEREKQTFYSFVFAFFRPAFSPISHQVWHLWQQKNKIAVERRVLRARERAAVLPSFRITLSTLTIGATQLCDFINAFCKSQTSKPIYLGLICEKHHFVHLAIGSKKFTLLLYLWHQSCNGVNGNFFSRCLCRVRCWIEGSLWGVTSCQHQK